MSESRLRPQTRSPQDSSDSVPEGDHCLYVYAAHHQPEPIVPPAPPESPCHCFNFQNKNTSVKGEDSEKGAPYDGELDPPYRWQQIAAFIGNSLRDIRKSGKTETEAYESN